MTLIAIALAAVMPNLLALAQTAVAGTTTAVFETAYITAVNAAVTQAATQLIASGGDLAQTLKTVLSADNLKSLTTTALTAGVMNIAGINVNSAQGLTETSKAIAQKALIAAGVDSTVNGGSLGDNLLRAATTSTVNTLAVKLTNDIGALERTSDGNITEGGLVKIIAHATVGYAAQSLTGGSCSAGALGAATAELLAPHLTGAKLSVLIGTGLAALVTGEDLEHAIAAGLNVERNNRQLHAGEIALAQKNANLLQDAAAKQGQTISIEEAEARIEKQLLRWVDADSNDGKVDELVVSIIGFKGRDQAAGFDWDYRDYATLNPEQYNDASINNANIPLYSDALSSSNQGLTFEQINDRNVKVAQDAVVTIAATAATLGGAGLAVYLVRLAPTIATAAKVSVDACLANLALCANQAGIFVSEIVAGDALGGASIAGATAATVKKSGSLVDDLAEAAGRFRGAGARLPDFDLSKIDSPKGKSYDGTTHRYDSSNRVDTTWDQHQGNIDASHRYTREGQGGVYGGTSQKTALDEVTYDRPLGNKIPVQKNIKLDNVLDLTDPKVRSQIGVTLDDLRHGTDYTKTQQIGKWAKDNGYDGILAPSARDTGGSNIVILKND